MSTAIAPDLAVCINCGDEFEVIKRPGPRRQVCYTCNPVKHASASRQFQKIDSPHTAKGTPFTVPHFKRWAGELILDNDRPWKPDPFFCDFLEDLFSDRFDECWLVVPEGNGKTTSIAGLCLYWLAHKPHAKIPWAAASREQARIGYEQSEGMILRTKNLGDVFRAYYGYREIRLKENQATKVQIYAADEKTGDGIIPNAIAVLDELHRHKNLGLYRTWRGKLFKSRDDLTGRPGGKIVVISTAGEPRSEFENTREAIRQQGVQTRKPGFVRSEAGRVVLHDWSISPEQDPDDLEAVLAANPSPRITMTTLREKHESPTMSPQHWARLVCNRATRGASAAITELEWANALTTEAIPDGAQVWLGLDLGFKLDTTAIAPVWDRGDETCIIGPAVILAPPRDGTQLNPHEIEDAMRRLSERYEVVAVTMDPSHGAQMAAWIAEELNLEVIERPQGNPLACQEYEHFMEGLRTGRLLHTGDPGLTSHVMNAIGRLLPGGDTRFDRPVTSRTNDQEAERRVIDALKAASMAHSQLLLARGIIKSEPPRVINLHDLPDDEEVAA